jgi:hypothetical protein
MFAGLLHPLYQEDQLRAQRLTACLHAASANRLATQNCYAQQRIFARDAIDAFEGTYGEVRAWPISISLVCILPPLLCYALIRFLLFFIRGALPPSQAARKQT